MRLINSIFPHEIKKLSPEDDSFIQYIQRATYCGRNIIPVVWYLPILTL